MTNLTVTNVNDIVSILTCPISLEPMITAVSFSPCSHKINEAAAKRLYGEILNGCCTITNKQCILCKQIVRAYYPDHTFRDLVCRILNISPPEEILKQVYLQFPENPITLEQKPFEDIPFPGIPARFIHDGGDWNYFDSGADLSRMLDFKSVTPDSLFSKFSLSGYRDGSVTLYIKFKSQEACEYLRHYELIVDGIDSLLNSYFARTPENMQKLFVLIAKHNEIPQSHFNLIKDVVSSGRCETTFYNFNTIGSRSN